MALHLKDAVLPSMLSTPPVSTMGHRCRLTQPIPFEHFSREWMNISGQDTFDGFRLEGAKQVCSVLFTSAVAFLCANL